MKLPLKLLCFTFTMFFLNVVFYFLSEDYRDFLAGLKYQDTLAHTENDDSNISDAPINQEEIPKNSEFIEFGEIDLSSAGPKNEGRSLQKIQTIFPVKKEKFLGKNYQTILNRFTSEYVLKKIAINSNLFELTDEYPDPYYEYYSPDVTIYLFPSRSYNEIFDIFDYLSGSLPFSLNTVNNFGEYSFYINLNENIVDDFVRLVISENGATFGLKIKKNEYNNVKNILMK